MPTFLIGEFKMRFYSNDHPPAHVHCINGDGVAVVKIATGEVTSIKGRIKTSDVVRAQERVEEHRDKLPVEWNLFQIRRYGFR